MTDSKPVSKYPSMNKKDQNNKNLVTESCNVKKTLKTDDIKDTIDQNMDKYPVNLSPFVVPHLLDKKKKIMHEIADKVDAPPPSYKSMIQKFLMDEPPQYGYAIGVEINVNEVKLFSTVCQNTQSDKGVFLLFCLVGVCLLDYFDELGFLLAFS